MTRLSKSVLAICLLTVPVMAQTPAPAQPPAGERGGGARRGARTPTPARDPHTPGYVQAKELPEGALPSPKENGNFIIGPTYTPAPETVVKPGVPQGQIFEFTMQSTESKIYPGIARDPNAATDPQTGRRVIATIPQPYSRVVAVYVPKQYVPGTEAPFIVTGDGYRAVFPVLDNLIAEKRVPVMIAIAIANGGNDAQGSQRGLEYDTMSGLYAQFVDTEVLPRVEKEANVKLTKNPDGRATLGCSSGAAAAMSMAWYRNDLFRRVVSYSGTYVYQQWPPNPETPHGAWDYHETIIPNSAKKPIRIWMHVSDRDNLSTRDEYHDWVLANERMAKVLADKGYPYQFVFSKNSGHCDGGVRAATLPLALEYVWQGYSK